MPRAQQSRRMQLANEKKSLRSTRKHACGFSSSFRNALSTMQGRKQQQQRQPRRQIANHFSAARFRLRARVCAHSVTISSFTKEELLFASKSAYFEISVCIYKKKRRKKIIAEVWSSSVSVCAVRVHLLVFHSPLSLSLLLHFVHTVKNEKKVFLLPPCGCIASHACEKWRRRLHS